MTAHTCKKTDVIGPHETAYRIASDENGLYAVHDTMKQTITVESTNTSGKDIKISCYTRMKEKPEFLRTDLTGDTPSTGYERSKQKRSKKMNKPASVGSG